MKAILDDRQRKHDPQNFMANGVISRSPEQPARIDVLKSGAQAAGYTFGEARASPPPCQY